VCVVAVRVLKGIARLLILLLLEGADLPPVNVTPTPHERKDGTPRLLELRGLGTRRLLRPRLLLGEGPAPLQGRRGAPEAAASASASATTHGPTDTHSRHQLGLGRLAGPVPARAAAVTRELAGLEGEILLGAGGGVEGARVGVDRPVGEVERAGPRYLHLEPAVEGAHLVGYGELGVAAPQGLVDGIDDRAALVLVILHVHELAVEPVHVAVLPAALGARHRVGEEAAPATCKPSAR
jgi:hypothetical protein